MIEYGYIDTSDGEKVFYELETPKNRLKNSPTLVFCYGLLCSRTHWKYQMEFLKNRYQILYIDYRGHHNSPRPKSLDSMTIERIAQDLLGVLDFLKFDNCILLAHSMGASVALECLMNDPQRFSKCVLVSGVARKPLETLLYSNIFDLTLPSVQKLHQRYPLIFELPFKAAGFSVLNQLAVGLAGFNLKTTPFQDIKIYMENIMHTDFEILITMILNYNDYDCVQKLHKIKTPILMISGAQDHVTPLSKQQELIDLIPSRRSKLLLEGSHCPQLDDPILISKWIEEFLEEKTSHSSSSVKLENIQRTERSVQKPKVSRPLPLRRHKTKPALADT